MLKNGIVPRSKVELCRCPYCGVSLNTKQLLQRKMKRKFRCGSCGKVVDERFFVY